MSSKPLMDEGVREKIIAKPDIILEDQDVMRALASANVRGLGSNVIDLRGVAMDRLAAKLDRLEDTHKSVISAAYENLAGTNQVHRAILRMLDPIEFEDFLNNLNGEVSQTLRVDSIKLVLETTQDDAYLQSDQLDDVLIVADPGYIDDYITQGANASARLITLRPVEHADPAIYGDLAAEIRSESCMKLNLGDGRLPGMLVMGAKDADLFKQSQGTDLLTFFAGVFERSMRRWLS
ncbi:DUF484 family protein [Parasulfitobacter algicola]|uniref:DUF484 family protein n=1 Tax=Parasulfitobacter algicola TaxID=2614809 RepID=A0ABX2J0A2_9RHOB|nr:DUF484 family protein [Sulfitobacter algicola]NSX56499.1 DUF484 family protein [Sulfitobacter algicola]